MISCRNSFLSVLVLYHTTVPASIENAQKVLKIHEIYNTSRKQKWNNSENYLTLSKLKFRITNRCWKIIEKVSEKQTFIENSLFRQLLQEPLHQHHPNPYVPQCLTPQQSTEKSCKRLLSITIGLSRSPVRPVPVSPDIKNGSKRYTSVILAAVNGCGGAFRRAAW